MRYITKPKNISFQTLRKINTSVYQYFILLANLCKFAGTIIFVFLAGKLRINPFDKYNYLSGLKQFRIHFRPNAVKLDTISKMARWVLLN